MSENDIDLWIRWKKDDLKYHGREHAEEYAESDQTLFNSSDHVTTQNWLSDHLKAEDKPMSRLLDLGCGTGRWFHVEVANAHTVIAVDFSRAMLKCATEKVNRNGYNNVYLIQADVFHLPFKEDLFDCVVSLGVIDLHAPLTKGLLEEVRKVVKEDGLFLFTVLKRGWVTLLMVQIAWEMLPLIHVNIMSQLKERIMKARGLCHNIKVIRRMVSNKQLFRLLSFETRRLNHFIVCTCKKDEDRVYRKHKNMERHWIF
jgi:ubiquinone/menaquinone biosynthesis C-methylase UbiE